MNVFKRNRVHNLILILGLILLILPLALSVRALVALDKARSQRTISYNNQTLFDGIKNSLRDLLILAQISNNDNTSQQLIQLSRIQLASKLSTLHKENSSLKNFSSEMIEAEKLLEEILKDKNYTQAERIQSIRSKIETLDREEQDRFIENEAKIIANTANVIQYSLFAFGLAFIVILFSIYLQARWDRQRTRFVYDMMELKEQAEVASKLKSSFLSTVSHEIRTPLNGIIGIADLLGQCTTDEKMKANIKLIYQSGKSLLFIIQDILDYSKIESGTFELDQSSFALTDLLSQIEGTLKPLAQAKNLHLEFLTSEIPSIRLLGDRERILQIFNNLIGNALKFTPAGNVTVGGRVIKSQGGDVHIEFYVKDTGLGMTKEEVDNLFIPFFQGKRRGTSGEGGTGLGMSISQMLIHKMGGEIKLQSEPQQGTTVTFSIRLKKDLKTTNEKGPVKPLCERGLPTTSSPGPFKVYVAEDNEINQFVIRSMLEKMNVSFEIFENGEELLNGLTKESPNLILMDLQMPVLDGVNTTEKIRAQGNWIPIIALTADASAKDEETCLLSGMNAYLAKPFIYDDLKKKIDFVRSIQFVDSKSFLELEKVIGKTSLEKILSIMDSSIEKSIREIRQALSEDNLEAIRKLGHKLKSSARSVGAFALGDSYENMEAAKDKMTVLKNLATFIWISEGTQAELRGLRTQYLAELNG